MIYLDLFGFFDSNQKSVIFHIFLELDSHHQVIYVPDMGHLEPWGLTPHPTYWAVVVGYHIAFVVVHSDNHCVAR